jgi:hypothetical protein
VFDIWGLVSVASVIGLGYYLRLVLKRAQPARLNSGDSYRFLRTLMTAATLVVVYFLTTNTFVAVGPTLLSRVEWEAQAGSSERTGGMTYTTYKTSSLAIESYVRQHEKELPTGTLQRVNADIAAGKTSAIQDLAVYLAKTDTIRRDRAVLLLWCGRYLQAQGAAIAALGAYEAGLRLQPNDGRFLHDYSLLVADLGDPDRAYKILDAGMPPSSGGSASDFAYVQDAYGLLATNSGRLNDAKAAFDRSLAYAEVALREKAIGVREAAMFKNNASSASIRRGDLLQATRLLCQAVSLLEPSASTESNDDLITAKINLAVVLRNGGRLAEAKQIVRSLSANIGADPDSKGIIYILQAYNFIYTHEFATTRDLLNKAEDWYRPYYERSGIFGLRLARVEQLRQLAAYWERDWEKLDRAGGQANNYFTKLYTAAFSFERLVVDFVDLAASLKRNKIAIAHRKSEDINKSAASLQLSESGWAERLRAFSMYLEQGGKPEAQEIEAAASTLLAIEKVQVHYELMNDVVLDVFYPNFNGRTAQMQQYRADHNALLINTSESQVCN